MKTGHHHSRHEPDLLKAVRTIADRRKVTVAFLVDQFFLRLVEEERPRTDEELGVEQA